MNFKNNHEFLVEKTKIKNIRIFFCSSSCQSPTYLLLQMSTNSESYYGIQHSLRCIHSASADQLFFPVIGTFPKKQSSSLAVQGRSGRFKKKC